VTSQQEKSATTTTGTRFSFLAVVFSRWLVPIYLLAGALAKIVDGSPSHLPAALVQLAGRVDWDLLYILRLSIAAELTVAGVMLLLPRLSRLAGGMILGLFFPILVGDLLLGASSCGCFGAVAIPPIVTLFVDGCLFAGLVFFGGRDERFRWSPTLSSVRVLLAGLWTVFAFMLGFAVTPPAPAASSETGAVETEQVDQPAPLPEKGYFLPRYADWVGKKWTEIPLASWISGVPSDWKWKGIEYVLLYRKDCEHCHDLMLTYFSDVLPIPVLAVAVPEKQGFPEKNIQDFPCIECRKAELPSGVDWFFKTPVLIRIEDGVIRCAAETSVEDPLCLQ